MKNCRVPECPYEPSAGSPRCYFHDKINRGLMKVDRPTFVKLKDGSPWAPRADIKPQRRNVIASAVIDDEQRELMQVAVALGADQVWAQKALTRSGGEFNSCNSR